MVAWPQRSVTNLVARPDMVWISEANKVARGGAPPMLRGPVIFAEGTGDAEGGVTTEGGEHPGHATRMFGDSTTLSFLHQGSVPVDSLQLYYIGLAAAAHENLHRAALKWLGLSFIILMVIGLAVAVLLCVSVHSKRRS